MLLKLLFFVYTFLKHYLLIWGESRGSMHRDQRTASFGGGERVSSLYSTASPNDWTQLIRIVSTGGKPNDVFGSKSSLFFHNYFCSAEDEWTQDFVHSKQVFHFWATDSAQENLTLKYLNLRMAALRWLRQEDFGASLVYTVSLRPAWSTYWDLVRNKQRNNAKLSTTEKPTLRTEV